MKRSNRYFLLICILLMVGGCATGHSKRQVLESGSQVELRSYQTRSYDTTDKVRVLRSVMATLQDLGFVIDKADDVVGVVSATKLDGYAMSMSVSVRANGEQTTVRANAQYNLKAIEQPGPYQDFFAALDKGLFLDRNTLADDLPARSPPANETTNPTTNSRQAGISAASGSVYDYYGEAEAEITSGTYNKNLWARALVVAEGDEQKRKARYIELRAQQLFADSGSPSSTRAQPTRTRSSADEASSGGVSGNGVSQAVPTSYGGNISGTYIAEISSNNQRFFNNISSGLVFTLEQDGNRISAANSDYNLKIAGTRNGDTIDFFVEPHRMNYYQDQQGVLKISPDGSYLEGSWRGAYLGASGNWNMTRLATAEQGTAAKTTNPAARPQTGVDLTGSYYSKISGTYKAQNVEWIRIEQSGDRITGSSPGKEWEIEGVVEGSTVRFKWFNRANKGKGKFAIDASGNLSGDFHGDSWGQGRWELTRIN